MLLMPNHPAPPLIVDEPELAALHSLARAGRTEQRLATRARTMVAMPEGPALGSEGSTGVSWAENLVLKGEMRTCIVVAGRIACQVAALS